MSAGQGATTAGPVIESVELHVAAGAEAASRARPSSATRPEIERAMRNSCIGIERAVLMLSAAARRDQSILAQYA